MLRRLTIDGTVSISPRTRFFTLLWLIFVWGTLLATGCSEDGIMSPTMSGTTGGSDSPVFEPLTSLHDDPTTVQEVELEH